MYSSLLTLALCSKLLKSLSKGCANAVQRSGSRQAIPAEAAECPDVVMNFTVVRNDDVDFLYNL
jgi:hypothetical protein